MKKMIKNWEVYIKEGYPYENEEDSEMFNDIQLNDDDEGGYIDDEYDEDDDEEYYIDEDDHVHESLITEDGDGGGAGSGDVGGGGLAYANNSNISGMGAVQNATVSETPGDPDGSIPGSGDVSFPIRTYTNNTGLTGNAYTKIGVTKKGSKTNNMKKFLQQANKVKDELGVGKVMSFQSFINQ